MSSVLRKMMKKQMQMKVLGTALAMGMLSFPVSIVHAADGGNITRVGATGDDANLMKDGIANIYPEAVSAAGRVGLNRFTDFDIKNGEIANLFFNQENSAISVNTLINMVQKQINVAGTVNAIRNNAIGGNLVFMSPKGMVINAGGVVNAGALNIMTPTEDFFNKAAYGIKKITTTVTPEGSSDPTTETKYELATVNLFNKDDATADKVANFLALNGAALVNDQYISGVTKDGDNFKTVTAQIPINPTGSISVQGTVNAATAIRLKAANIDISNGLTETLLQTGVSFGDITNLGTKEQAVVINGTPLTVTVETNSDGKNVISLTDPSIATAGTKYYNKTTVTETEVTPTAEEGQTAEDPYKLTVYKSEFDPTKGADSGPTTDEEAHTTTTVKYTDDVLSDVLKGDGSITVAAEANGVNYRDADADGLTKFARWFGTYNGSEPEIKASLEKMLANLLPEDKAALKLLLDKAASGEATYQDVWNQFVYGANDTAKAELTIKTMANIKAAGNVNLTSTAKIERALKENEASDLSKQLAGTIANLTINGGNITGADVNISADAVSIYNAESSAGLGSVLLENQKMTNLKDKLPDCIMESEYVSAAGDWVNKAKDLANELHVSLGIASAKANTDINKLATIKAVTVKDAADVTKIAGGNLTAAANSEASVTMNIAIDPHTQPTPENPDPDGTTPPADEKKWLNGGLAWVDMNSQANIDVQGQLTADNALNVNSNAKATTDNKLAIKGEPSSTDNNNNNANQTLQSYLNAAVGLVNITNTAQTIIGSEDNHGSLNNPLLKADGDLSVGSNAVNSIKSQIGVQSDDKTLASTAVNIIGTHTGATTDEFAKVEGKKVTVSADNTTSALSLNTTNAFGKEDDQWKQAKDKFMSLGPVQSAVDGLRSLTGSGSANANTSAGGANASGSTANAPANADHNDRSNANGLLGSGNNSNESRSWNQNFDIGASVAVATLHNDAVVNLKPGAQLTATGTDADALAVRANINIADTQIKTTDLLVNENNDAKLGVAAAVAVENAYNNARVNTEGTAPLAKTVLTSAGGVSVTANVDNSFKRVDTMLAQMDAGVDKIVKGIDDLISSAKDESLKNDLKAVKTGAAESLKTTVTNCKNSLTGQGETSESDGLLDTTKVMEAAEKVFTDLKTIGKKFGEDEKEAFKIVLGTAKQMTDAANYCNMYTSASASQKDGRTTSLVDVTGTVGIQNIHDGAYVNINHDTSINAADTAPLRINATVKNDPVQLAGKWTMVPTLTNEGSEFGIGGTVGIQNAYSNSQVNVYNGVTVNAGSIDVNTDTKNIGVDVVVGGTKSSKLGASGMVAYMGGWSDSRTQIDDDATLTATGNISLKAHEQAILTNVAGEVTKSKAAAIGASVGVMSFDTWSQAKVANIETIDTDGVGTFTANNVIVDAANDGVLNTLTVAGVSAKSAPANNLLGSGSNDTGSNNEIGGTDVHVRERTESGTRNADLDNLSTSSNSDHVTSNTPSTSGSNPTNGSAEHRENGIGQTSQNDANAQAEADSAVKLSLAGSVSVNDVDNRTIAQLDQVNIVLNGSDNKVDVKAIDSNYIGTYSGAMAMTKAKNSNGSTSFGGTLSGAVAVNDITKSTEASLKETTISNATELNNYAENDGTQIAAGIALGITKGDRSEGGGFGVSGSASVDLVNSKVKAIMDNVTETGSQGNVNNTAYDKDIQIAGGISVDYAKTTVGIGAAVSVANITNDIGATIKGGTLGTDANPLAQVHNLAASNLTQIAGALSLGLSDGYANLNAAVAVDDVKNDVRSEIKDAAQITANTVSVEAVDGAIVKSSDNKTYVKPAPEEDPGKTQNKHYNALKGMTGIKDSTQAEETQAFDIDGKEALLHANRKLKTDAANTGKGDISLQTNPDGTVVTQGDGDDKQANYNAEEIKATNKGNLIVGSALDITIGTGKASGATAGAGVIYDTVNNDFTAKISDSTIKTTGTGTNDAAVNVKAESDTEMVGVAAGVATKTNSEAKGVAGAGSGAVQFIDNDTVAAIENSTVTAAKTKINAETKSTLTTVAGQVGVSLTNVALGMTWAQNTLDNTTGAYARGLTLNSIDTDKTTDLSINALNNSKAWAIAAGTSVEASVNGKTFSAAMAGAYATNDGKNSTEAVMEKYVKDGSADKTNTVSNAANVSATAADNTKLEAVAGTINVTAGKSTVGLTIGGTVANNNIGSASDKQSIKAAINDTEITAQKNAAITVKADNNAQLETFAVGGGVTAGIGTAAIGAQGSVALSDIYSDTVAEMVNTDITSAETDNQIKVTVAADSKNDNFTTADGMSVTAGTQPVAVSAMAAVSVLNSKADTSAKISGGSYVVKDAVVKAKSENLLNNITAGLNVAATTGVAGVTTVGNVSVNNLQNNTKALIENNAVINAANNIAVTADSKEQLNSYGGALSVAASSTAGVAVGATVVVNTIGGDTVAQIDNSQVTALGKDTSDKQEVTEYKSKFDDKNHVIADSEKKAKNGLIVNAEAQHELNDISVTAGVGGAGVAGIAVQATVIDNTIAGNTAAKITNSTVNQSLNLADAPNANVSVRDYDNTKISSNLGTLSIGGGGVTGVGAGAAVDVNNFTRSVTAEISATENTDKTNNKTVNGNNIDINALNQSKILLTESGASAGVGATAGVGVTGVVSVDTFKDNTIARMQNINSVNNGLIISANSAKDLESYANSAAIAGGYAAVGVSTTVVDMSDNGTTAAYLKNSKIQKGSTAGNVSVLADNKARLSLENAAGALSIGLGGGIAANVAVNNFHNTVSTYVDNNTIGSSSAAVGDFNVKATNKLYDKFTNVATALGLAGIGAGVGVNTVDSATVNNISGTNVYAGNITVEANENRNFAEEAVAVSGGAVGINTNVMITNVGTAVVDNYADEDNSKASFSTTDIQAKTSSALSDAKNTQTLLSSESSKYTKDVVAKDVITSTDFDKGGSGTGVQNNLNGVVLYADNKADIRSIAHTDTDIDVVQSGGGGLETNVGVAYTDVATKTGVTVKGADIVANTVNIASTTEGTLEQNVDQFSIGAFGANVAVSRVTRTGDNLITIGDEAGQVSTLINGREALNINATDNMKINEIVGKDLNLSAGGVAIEAIFSKAYDYSNTKVNILGNTNLKSVKNTIKEDFYQADLNTNLILRYDNDLITDESGKVLYTVVYHPKTTDDGDNITYIYRGEAKDNDETNIINKIVDTVDADKKHTVTVYDRNADGTYTQTTKTANEVLKLKYKHIEASLGDINISATNANDIYASASAGAVGVASGTGVVAKAIEGKGNTGLTEINVSGQNKFTGKNVSLVAVNNAKVQTDDGSLSAGLAAVGVTQSEAAVYGSAKTIIGDEQTFVADNVSLDAHAANNVLANAKGVSTGGVGVATNFTKAISDVDVELSVGKTNYQKVYQTGLIIDEEINNKQYITKEVPDPADPEKTIQQTEVLTTKKQTVTIPHNVIIAGETNLNLAAYTKNDLLADVYGLSAGLIASGTNDAETQDLNTVTLNFNPGQYSAASLNIEAGVNDKDTVHANGDGGGIIGINPEAAKAKHTNTTATTINLSGTYDIAGDVSVIARNTLTQNMRADAIQAQLAGGSGVSGSNTVNNSAVVNLYSAKITADGKVDIGSNNIVSFNTDGEDFVKSSGYGLLLGVADGNIGNTVTTNSTTNINGSTDIVSNGNQTYWAKTDNNITSNLNVYSTGILNTNIAKSTLNVTANDKVTTASDSTLKTMTVGKDLVLSASDDQTLANKVIAESVAGISAVCAYANNNINRNNDIIVDGSVFGMHDVKLLAGQGTNGSASNLRLDSDAEAFNRALLPLATDPEINNKFIQKNHVNINGSGKVQAVHDVDLYSDAGRETTVLFVDTYTSYGSKGESTYVSTKNGKSTVTGETAEQKGKTAENYVKVDGTVTAGIGNEQYIKIENKNDKGNQYLVFLDSEAAAAEEAYAAALAGGNAGDKFIILLPDDEDDKREKDNSSYNYAKISDFVSITNKDGTDISDVINLHPADFKTVVIPYAEKTMERLNELSMLIEEYSDSPGTSASYKAEYKMLQDQMKNLGLMNEKGEVIGTLDVYAINLPELTASGGNINAQTGDLYGNGNINAQGSPKITVENNTSLATVVNNVTVGDPGGNIYYNTILMDPAEPTADIKEHNQDKTKTVTAAAAPGDTGKIEISGENTWNKVNLSVQYVDEADGQTKTKIAEQKVLADLFVTGEVRADKGDVTIKSAHDNINIVNNGAVVGATTHLFAEQGSISQSYIDSIVNINGDPQDQINIGRPFWDNKPDCKEYIRGKQQSGSFADLPAFTTGGRISGDNIYINAADININGIIQSGYDKIFVDISSDTRLTAEGKIDSTGTSTSTLGNRITQLDKQYAGTVLDDANVRRNSNFKVISGGEFYNETKGYYEYVPDVYYNPYTGNILLSDVDISGGHIYLTGNIASTGYGKIFCLDGTYDLDIKNNLANDLVLGKLSLNNVGGKIDITDIRNNMETVITRSGNGTKVDIKDLHGKLIAAGNSTDYSAINSSYDSKKAGAYYTSASALEYRPAKDLSYNWTVGDSHSKTYTYQKTYYNTWWGAGGEHTTSEALKAESETATIINESPEGTPYEKRNGAYIGDLNNIDEGVRGWFKNVEQSGEYYDYAVFEDHEITKDYSHVTNTRSWSQGYLNCHEYTEVTWDEDAGWSNSYFAYIKADRSVPISFIGNTNNNSAINLYAKGNIELTNNFGDTQLYENNIQHGTVNIESVNGSIRQTGGSIYGNSINLKAKGSIEGVNITAGDTVNITTAVGTDALPDGRKIELTVNGNRGAKGNVVLDNDLGNVNTDNVSLKALGDITQKSGTVIIGKRIDLDSVNGSITAVVNAGQEAVGSDSLSASLNASAMNKITLTQKTGNMRIGTIESKDGDVILNVPGTIVDALPYENMSKDTENALYEKWQNFGLIADKAKGIGSDAAQKRSEELREMKNKANAAHDAVLSKYDRQEFKEILEKIYENDPEKEAKIKTAIENVKKPLVDGYTAWDKNALLYAIPDAIVNPEETKPDTANKMPNVVGKNVTINVGDSVGLLSDNVTEFKASDLSLANGSQGLNYLKQLSRADASTVSWIKTADGKDADITITEKLPIGVQLNIGGKLTVGNNDASAPINGNVYIQGRNNPAVISAINDIAFDSINAKGDVYLTSLGNLTSTAAEGLAAVTAKTLYISAYGSIGTVDNPFAFELTGNDQSSWLQAISSSGNLYLDSLGSKDLYIKSMSANNDLQLTGKGNIYSYNDPNTSGNIVGYIKANGDNIKITAGGDIGQEPELDANGNPKIKGTRKALRIENTDNEMQTVTVKAGEGKSIYLEGYTNKPDYTEAGGTLNVTVDNSQLKNVEIYANGNLAVNGTYTVDNIINLNAENNLTNNSNISAADRNIKFNSQNGNITNTGNLEANTVVIKADSGSVTNSGDITINGVIDGVDNTDDTLWMAAWKDVTNTGRIEAKQGNIYLISGINSNNSFNRDDWTINPTASEAKLLNTVDSAAGKTGKLYAILGDVKLLASGDVTNNSDVMVMGGSVQMESVNGNVINHDKLSDIEESEKAKYAGKDFSTGSISLIAKKGKVENDFDLIAKNMRDKPATVKIEAKESLGNLAYTIKADNDIELISYEGNILNSSTLESEHGNITLKTPKGIIANLHAAKNDETDPDKAKGNIIAKEGNVNLLAGSKGLTGTYDVSDFFKNEGTGKINKTLNLGSILNNGNILALGENSKIDIMSANADIFSYTAFHLDETDQTKSVSVGDLTLSAENGKLVTMSDIASTHGSVTLTAKEGLTEIAKNVLANKDITLTATSGDIKNTASLISYSGDIRLNANEGNIENVTNANIIALGGNVTLKSLSESASHNVTNSGDILALTDNAATDRKSDAGNIILWSNNGNVTNYDDFNKFKVDKTSFDWKTDFSGILSSISWISGKDDAPKENYNIAANNLILAAPKGTLNNDKDYLAAEGRIELIAKDGLNSFGKTIYAGKDVKITATEGNLVNNAKIISLTGNVALEATNGAVVNSTDGNIITPNGSITLHGGGNETGAGRDNTIYYIDNLTQTGTITIEGAGISDNSIIAVERYYQKAGESDYTKLTNVDDIAKLSVTEKSTICSVFCYIDDAGVRHYDAVTAADEIGKPLNKKTITVEEVLDDGSKQKVSYQAIDKAIEAYRDGDAINRGNAIAMGTTNDGKTSSYVKLWSDNSNVTNYDDLSKEHVFNYDGSKFNPNGKTFIVTDKDGNQREIKFEGTADNIMVTNGDISLTAPNGYMYNNLQLKAKGNIELVSDQSISSGVSFVGDIEAGGSINILSRNGNVEVGNVKSDGAVYIGAGEDGDHSQTVTVKGTVEAPQVILYNGNTDPNSKLTVENVKVGDSLVIQAGSVDIKNIERQEGNDTLHIIATGVEGGTMNGQLNIDIPGDTYFDVLNVTDANINITDGGSLGIDKMHINGEAHFTAKDYTTAVYGGDVPNGDNSNSVYWDTGKGGQAVDLGLREAYTGHADNLIKQLAEKGEMARTIAANPGKLSTPSWMNLYTDSSNHQKSNGLLLHIQDYHYADNQRFALDDLNRKVNDENAIAVQTAKFADILGLMFNRHDILDISAMPMGDIVGYYSNQQVVPVIDNDDEIIALVYNDNEEKVIAE